MFDFMEIRDNYVYVYYAKFRPISLILNKHREHFPQERMPLPLQLASIVEFLVRDHPHLRYREGKLPIWIFADYYNFLNVEASKRRHGVPSSFRGRSYEIHQFLNAWRSYGLNRNISMIRERERVSRILFRETKFLCDRLLEIDLGVRQSAVMEIESESDVYITDGNTVRVSKGGSVEKRVVDKSEKGSVDPSKFHTESFKRLNDYAKCKESLDVANWICGFTLLLELSMSIFSQATELTTLIKK